MARSVTVAACILGGAAVAWLVVLRQADGMQSAPGTMGLGVVAFLGLWLAMMAAMMLPALAPLGVMLAGERAGRPARLAGLIGGYLAAWAAFGVLALALSALSSELVDRSERAGVAVGALLLITAGVYQLTPFKDRCLSLCRSPLRILMHVGAYPGPFRHLRAGIYHGGYCVGCCWALMVALIALGIMDLRWMVAFSVVITLEKLWRHGERFSYAVGVGLVVLGLLAPWHPGIVPGLHRAPMTMTMAGM
jgi:predicted metal-binding membrane protein